MNNGLPRRNSGANLAAFFGVESKATPLKASETELSDGTGESVCLEMKENNMKNGASRHRNESDASSQTPILKESNFEYLDKASEVAIRTSLIFLSIISYNKFRLWPHDCEEENH